MRFTRLSSPDLELVERAKDLITRRRSKISSVAAVLKTKSNKIFSGVNIEIEASAPCSICAEYAAIGTMVSEGEIEIDTIVAFAYSENQYAVLQPCGKCRQLINEFGNPYVIFQVDQKLKKVRLSELYPLPVTSD